jgi:hypothetical protein
MTLSRYGHVGDKLLLKWAWDGSTPPLVCWGYPLPHSGIPQYQDKSRVYRTADTLYECYEYQVKQEMTGACLFSPIRSCRKFVIHTSVYFEYVALNPRYSRVEICFEKHKPRGPSKMNKLMLRI